LGALALLEEGAGQPQQQALVVGGQGQGGAVLLFGLGEAGQPQQGVGQVLAQGDVVGGDLQGLPQAAEDVVVHGEAARPRPGEKHPSHYSKGSRSQPTLTAGRGPRMRGTSKETGAARLPRGNPTPPSPLPEAERGERFYRLAATLAERSAERSASV